MRKNSKQAAHITALVHKMLAAIEAGDVRCVHRAFSDAWCLDRQDRRRGGSGYSLLWFAEIAQQYPTALALRPDLVEFLEVFALERRARIRGRRDFTLGYMRDDNPYCGYTEEVAYAAWHEGWDAGLGAFVDEEIDEEVEEEDPRTAAEWRAWQRRR